MNRYWINVGLALLVSSALLGLPSQTAHGLDAVYCTNCGTEWTQLMNKAMMVKQLANQAQQLSTQINQYKDMLTNSNGVSQHLWGKAMSDFNQLNQLMGRSRSLAYSAGDLDGQFGNRYGTYDAYLNKKMGASDWKNKYAQWSKEGNDNALFTLKGLGLHASQLQNDQLLQQRLQGMASSAQGRMEALQVANMMAAQNADQLMKLRELMMLQLQMQANFIAQQQDRQAAQDAARQNYFKVYKSKLNGERF
jgi:P-type conjugative transfer protein TrbJ